MLGYVPDEGLTVAGLLVEAVARRPDAVAVRFDSESVCFAEFDRRVASVAGRLRQCGVGPEVVVAVAVHRGIDMVVAVHAVLRAGGGYVPLDPAYPAERIRFVLSDSDARVVLGHSSVLAGVPETGVVTVALDDANMFVDVAEPVGFRPPGLDDLAYVIYTSGSTGQPKGVAVTHRSLSLLVTATRQAFSAGELAVCAAATSLTFDVSVFELIVTLAAGGSVRVFEDAIALIDSPDMDDVTMLTVVPSAAAELVRRHALPAQLKVLIGGGEPFTRTLAEALFADRPGLRVVNGYGPTEATVAATWAVLQPGDAGPPPIGVALPHVQLHVVDEALRSVPSGEWGELLIAGPALARGYLHEPADASSPFLSNTVSPSPGQRMYRTGDLCRLRPDGQYDIAGRKDQQVKVRGYRIETTEVEAALQADIQVRHAAVLTVTDTSGLASLVAAVVPEQPGLPPEQLRAALGAVLPGWMIPSRFVMVEALPHLANGKVDRAGLQQQFTATRTGRRDIGRPAVTHLEQLVAGLMGDLLTLEVGADDDFFLDLGATSLHGVRLLTEVHRATGALLPMQTLMTHTTAASLAAVLDGHGAQTPQPVVVLNQGAADQPALFLMSAWFGQTLGYRRLVRHLYLPQLPVIAVCPQIGVPGDELTSMQAMAERCIDLIRRQQPTGPYLLGGYSMGGMLAHEIGARLTGEGEQVLPLLLLDAAPRLTGVRALLDEAFHLTRPAIATVGPGTGRQAVAQLTGRIASRRRRKAAVTALHDDVMTRTQQAQDIAPAGMLAHLESLDAANFEAVESWHPRRSPLSAILIATPETVGYRGRTDLGWRPYLQGTIRQVKFPSRHLTMMLEPDIAALGPVVRHELQHLIQNQLA